MGQRSVRVQRGRHAWDLIRNVDFHDLSYIFRRTCTVNSRVEFCLSCMLVYEKFLLFVIVIVF